VSQGSASPKKGELVMETFINARMHRRDFQKLALDEGDGVIG